MSNYYRLLFTDFIEENSFETGVEHLQRHADVVVVEDLVAFLDELDKGSDKS